MPNEKIVAVDIGGSKVRIQTVDRNGGLGPENLAGLIGLNLDNKKFTQLLSENIRLVMDAKTDADILAISIGSPGPLDTFKGVIETAPNLKGIKNLAIVAELKDIFDWPVFLLNDADAAGLGEWWLGAGTGYNSVDYLTWSTGIGSSEIRNGRLQRGLGKAPEWGHTSIGIENKWWLCGCGQWSCAEAYLGTNGLAKTYVRIFEVKESDLTEKDRHEISYKMREGIKAGDRKWLRVQEEYAKHSAVLLRNMILVDQPQIIVIGGGIAYSNEPLLEEVKKQLKELMDPQKDKMAIMAEGVKIALAQLENAVNIGAAKYAFDLIDLARKGEKEYGDMV